LRVEDYSQSDLDNAEQKEVLCSYITANRKVLSLIRAHFETFKDGDFAEICAYALREVFKIENLDAEMLRRSYNLRSSIVLRLAEKNTAKADTSKNNQEVTINDNVMKLIQEYRDSKVSIKDIQDKMFASKQFTNNEVLAHIFAQNHKEKLANESKAKLF
jgi:hypothetical protein